jgi:hypothetical protein
MEDKRLNRRQALDIKARFNSKRLISEPCIIQDFSLRGMFLAWRNADPDKQEGAARLLELGETITVTFQVRLKNEDPKPYAIKAKLVRVVSDGIAVEIVESNPKAQAILKHFADKAERSDAQRVAQESKKQESPVNGQQVKSPERGLTGGAGLATKHMDEIFSRFIIDGEWRFQEAMREAKSSIALNDARQDFEAFQSLAQSAKVNCHKCVNALSQRINGQEDELSLQSSAILGSMETQDLEFYFLFSGLIDRTEQHVAPYLYQLEARLSWLAAVRINRHNNPIGVAIICHQFAEVFAAGRLRPVATQTVFSAFEHSLNIHLPVLYDDLNVFFRQQGVPAELYK